ncbi:hypothetical protein CCAX7_33190 [Capsulimonas corticalis]|uniref:Uncharacterized protein n=1 Tax=Capsulimonas corticalis TaxID=2219043 RepID=A0A402CYM7_9BACT|nr:hypothetical protein CCAX7_33190 [Capsulimonas corticalis]
MLKVFGRQRAWAVELRKNFVEQMLGAAQVTAILLAQPAQGIVGKRSARPIRQSEVIETTLQCGGEVVRVPRVQRNGYQGPEEEAKIGVAAKNKTRFVPSGDLGQTPALHWG